ncbi:MAG: hypothetical protein ACFN3F_00365 [Selenomonas sp.]|mgnify:FL=1
MRFVRYAILFCALVALFTGAMLYYGSTHRDEAQSALALLEEETLSPEEAAQEAARREAREAERLAEEAKRKEREARIEKLKEGMERIDSGSYAWYSYPEEKKLSGGLYVQPLLGHSRVSTFRCNILYYYSMHESSMRGWIFGDRFAIETDGERRTWEIEEKKRRDHLDKDVEFLTERSQIALGEDGAEVLRRAANARTARFIYWSTAEGKSVSHTLTNEEKRRLGNMIALYDLWQEP